MKALPVISLMIASSSHHVCSLKARAKHMPIRMHRVDTTRAPTQRSAWLIASVTLARGRASLSASVAARGQCAVAVDRRGADVPRFAWPARPSALAPVEPRRTIPRRKRILSLQTNVWQSYAGKAGCIPGARGGHSLRVAQSDAGIGSAAVLSGQLKEEPPGAVRGLRGSCNKADLWREESELPAVLWLIPN
jgi:hypothetical protein